jgi:glucose uptake protein GlcU
MNIQIIFLFIILIIILLYVFINLFKHKDNKENDNKENDEILFNINQLYGTKMSIYNKIDIIKNEEIILLRQPVRRNISASAFYL